MSKTIYLDSQFRCHTEIIPDLIETIITDRFDNYCDGYINGLRYVPEGKTWTREDGEVFKGEMISTWLPYDYLQSIQIEYEQKEQKIQNSYLQGVNSI